MHIECNLKNIERKTKTMQFRGNYYFLSNMYDKGEPLNIVIDGVPHTFTCAEAAFQAHKCPERADEFEHISGFEAKKLGRRVPLRNDWESVKDDVMLKCLREKFQNAYLQRKLVAVDEPIVEDNTWGDTYWGRCNGIGQNKLGRLLEQVKREVSVF